MLIVLSFKEVGQETARHLLPRQILPKMEYGIKEKMERWKVLAEQLLEHNKKIFIKDINDNWYFADILLVGDLAITIKCFAPVNRADEKINIHWAMIQTLDEFKEER